MKGSQNLAGISDPVIDALIDTIIAADSRTSLTTACMVLDRVIRTGHTGTRPRTGLLGRVRPTRDQTALRARHPRDLVVRSRAPWGKDAPLGRDIERSVTMMI